MVVFCVFLKVVLWKFVFYWWWSKGSLRRELSRILFFIFELILGKFEYIFVGFIKVRSEMVLGYLVVGIL